MRVPIAREGWFFSLPLAGAGILSGFCSYWLAFVFFSLAGYVLFFFRDPKVKLLPDDSRIVAPASGKVVRIDEVNVPHAFEDGGRRISIFMSLFDVHMSYAPLAGEVQIREYHPGSFKDARKHGVSLANERNILFCTGNNGPFCVCQIAGLIARRIVCFVKEADKFRKAQRIGMIRFGSRVDLIVPKNAKITCSLGDRLHGGRSVIGEMP